MRQSAVCAVTLGLIFQFRHITSLYHSPQSFSHLETPHPLRHHITFYLLLSAEKCGRWQSASDGLSSIESVRRRRSSSWRSSDCSGRSSSESDFFRKESLRFVDDRPYHFRSLADRAQQQCVYVEPNRPVTGIERSLPSSLSPRVFISSSQLVSFNARAYTHLWS